MTSLLQVSPQNVAVSTNGSAQRIAGLVREFAGDTRRWSQWKVGQYRSATKNPVSVEGVLEYGYPNPFVSLSYELVNNFTDARVPTLPFSGETLGLLPFSPPIDDADVVQVEYPWQFEYIEATVPNSTPLVYSSHNVEFERIMGMDGGWLTDCLAEYTRRIERRAVESADLVVTTSAEDRNTYQRAFDPGGPIRVLPNGADNVEWSPPEAAKGIDAVFVGSDYPPNVEAAERLLSVAGELPSRVNVHVVGTVERGLPDGTPEGIEIHGFVDDLDEFLRDCDVALNPVTAGSGSNVKIPKYLSHGLATVTTSFGARGFDLNDGKDCLIVDPAQFGTVLSSLASDEYDIEEIGCSGRKLFESSYDWTVVSKYHCELIAELIGEIR